MEFVNTAFQKNADGPDLRTGQLFKVTVQNIRAFVHPPKEQVVTAGLQGFGDPGEDIAAHGFAAVLDL